MYISSTAHDGPKGSLSVDEIDCNIWIVHVKVAQFIKSSLFLLWFMKFEKEPNHNKNNMQLIPLSYLMVCPTLIGKCSTRPGMAPCSKASILFKSCSLLSSRKTNYLVFTLSRYGKLLIFHSHKRKGRGSKGVYFHFVCLSLLVLKKAGCISNACP